MEPGGFYADRNTQRPFGLHYIFQKHPHHLLELLGIMHETKQDILEIRQNQHYLVKEAVSSLNQELNRNILENESTLTAMRQ